MRDNREFHELIGPLLFLFVLLCGSSRLQAQQSIDPGSVSDDQLTIVVATHFVSAFNEEISPSSQFASARIPLEKFNETDQCIDESALEAARTYFESLGRLLGKVGYYYVVPDADTAKAVAICVKLKGVRPQAWVENKTKVIAFGRVVPTADAPALERSMR